MKSENHKHNLFTLKNGSTLKITTVLISVFLFSKANAAVFTVNNNTGGAAQFSQINPAIAAANSGDTIYVNGSANAYSGCNISKSITLIGSGAFSQRQNGFATTIDAIIFGSNISNVTIEGFSITSSIIISKYGIASNTNINFVTIKNNLFPSGAFGLYFNTLTNSSNFLLSGNIFGSLEFSMNPSPNVNNITIENNIINGYINDIVCNNSLIQNNVFYNSANAFNSRIVNATIQNNIFYNSHPSNFATGCTFLNNITYNTSATYPTLTGAGNIDNTNPLFNNVGATGAYVSTYNFDLQPVSVAKNAGTDGKDLGIYGGSSFVALSGETYNMPVLRQMILLNTNAPQNGNVNVKVRSTKAR